MEGRGGLLSREKKPRSHGKGWAGWVGGWGGGGGRGIEGKERKDNWGQSKNAHMRACMPA